MEEDQVFAHEESRDGKNIMGSYQVNLPDGRLQIVEYVADDTGFHAEVKYVGEAIIPTAEELAQQKEEKRKKAAAAASASGKKDKNNRGKNGGKTNRPVKTYGFVDGSARRPVSSGYGAPAAPVVTTAAPAQTAPLVQAQAQEQEVEKVVLPTKVYGFIQGFESMSKEDEDAGETSEEYEYDEDEDYDDEEDGEDEYDYEYYEDEEEEYEDEK